MKAIIRQEPWDDRVSLYVIEHGRINHALTPEGWVEVPDDPGNYDPPPHLLSVDRMSWDAIVQAIGQHTQASDATVEALRDTRHVRDRLLTLVEQHAKP